MLVDDHPKGYPKLAAFVDSDENFSIFRKYGFLRNRVLLYRQDELAQLERTLIAMDEDDNGTNPDRLQCRQTDEDLDHEHTGDPIYTRKGLIKAIDDKLKEYGIFPFSTPPRLLVPHLKSDRLLFLSFVPSS